MQTRTQGCEGNQLGSVAEGGIEQPPDALASACSEFLGGLAIQPTHGTIASAEARKTHRC